MSDFTFLTEEQIFGENRLEIFKDGANVKAKATDFISYKGICSEYWTKSRGAYDRAVITVDRRAEKRISTSQFSIRSARLVLPLYSMPYIYRINRIKINESGFKEVEYGYYPQKFVSADLNMELSAAYHQGKLKQTGNEYTDPFDCDRKFKEYNLNEHRYLYYDGYERDGWIEVQPIKWLVDEKNKLMVTEKLLFDCVFKESGIYEGDFENTTIKKFIDNVFAKEIFQEVTLTKTKPEENQYGFTFDEVSEEDIIKGAINSNVPVFLHGKPGEGKSSRIKQIDPNCEVLSLGTLTPELLVGMGIKNSSNEKLN